MFLEEDSTQNATAQPVYGQQTSLFIFEKQSQAETDYFVFQDKTSNYAYKPGPDIINILFKDGTIKDIADAADELNISLLSRPVTKYFLCYPKNL